MTVYHINYDLKSPGKDYSDLFDAIQSLGPCTHILESSWFVDADGSAPDIRDELKQFVDSNDKLLVTKFRGGWGTTFSDDSTDWLHEHT